MASRLVVVKYGTSNFAVEVDPAEDVEVFKIQIFSLTGIPPEDQRIFGLTAGSLPDDSELGSLILADGQEVVLLANGEEVGLPAQDSEEESAAVGRVAEGGGVVQNRASSAGSAERSSDDDDDDDVPPSPSPDEILAKQLQDEEDAMAMIASSDASATSGTKSHPFINRCAHDRACGGGDDGFGEGREEGGFSVADGAAAALQTALDKPIAQRLRDQIKSCAQFDDPVKQALALSVLPVEELEENAAVALFKKTGTVRPDAALLKDAVLEELLHWFKGWFKWVDAPCCDFCEAPTTFAGHGTVSDEEVKYGGNRVEVYGCRLCGTMTRFVRYTDPAKLLETRRGRCGEWAKAFALMCRALDYKVRLVVDWTDHVWVECYSDHLGRWAHCDPCEDVYDRPLLYEKGWGKRLSYVFGFGQDGCVDVIRRYTRKWPEVAARRREISERSLEVLLRYLRAEVRSGSGLSRAELEHLLEADKKEQDEIRDSYSGRLQSQPSDPDRDKEALPGRQSGSVEWRQARGEANSSSGGDDITSAAAAAAVAAAAATTAATAAMTAAAAATAAAAMMMSPSGTLRVPARDDFVGVVFNGLRQIVRNVIAQHVHSRTGIAEDTDSPVSSKGDVSSAKEEEEEEDGASLLPRLKAVVSLLEEVVKEMGSQPYRSRYAKMAASKLPAAPGLRDLLTALGFKEVAAASASNQRSRKFDDDDVCLQVDGFVDIRSAIQLAVAMPVLSNLIERLKRSLRSCSRSEAAENDADEKGKKRVRASIERSMAWLLQGDRVCGGTVAASGENRPSEVAVNAFDGLTSSKWLDFGGKDGWSWIAYFPDTGANRRPLLRKLAAYEIIAAEDCPERDPRDWVLEGREEGEGEGSGDGEAGTTTTWYSLDTRRNILFSGRHTAKLFVIENPDSQPACNSYRFRFTSVRDPSAANSIQICCINLFAAASHGTCSER